MRFLEEFARSFAALSGYGGGALYEEMNRAGMEALERKDLPRVDTRFCGTRRQSDLRAKHLRPVAGEFQRAFAHCRHAFGHGKGVV